MDPFSRNQHHRSFPHYPSHPIQRPPVPKVVQIPVHFIGSESVDRSRSGSALKIQKVVRGFLVRKSMNRIRNVKKQVDEIEEKLWKREVVESIRRDQRERLRMSEGLMSLLLKLDSIGGFDLGVRDCRKAVIWKAIALQERIDAIVAAVDSVPCVEDAEKMDTSVTHCLNGCENDGKLEGCDGNLEGCVEMLNNFVETHCSNQSENDGKLEGCDAKLEDCVEMLNNSGEGFEDLAPIGLDSGEIENIVDVGVDSEIKRSVDAVEESLVENDEVKNAIGDWVELESDKEIKGRGFDDERNNELIDRMVQDNEKMMNMMTQLFDSNEKQMKMINALSYRVEMLEKAFMFDKQRKKKQKKKAAFCEDE